MPPDSIKKSVKKFIEPFLIGEDDLRKGITSIAHEIKNNGICLV